MPKICPRYTSDMPEIRPRCARDTPKIYTRYGAKSPWGILSFGAKCLGAKCLLANIVSWDLAYLLLCWPRVFLQSVHRYILDEVTWKIICHCTSPFISLTICQQQLYGRNVTSKKQDYQLPQNLQSLPFVHFRCAGCSPTRWIEVTETIQHFECSVFFERRVLCFKIPFISYR